MLLAPRTTATACRCGHDLDAHEHFRPGSDCGACGARACSSYRRSGPRHGAVDRLLHGRTAPPGLRDR